MCNTKKCIQVFLGVFLTSRFFHLLLFSECACVCVGGGYYLPYRVHLKYHYLTYESHLFIPLKINHMT